MIQIGHNKLLSILDSVAVALGEKVTVTKETFKLLTKRRKEITEFVKSQSDPAYGFNRGFGHNVDRAVSEEHLLELQVNLIRSHASGVGASAPKEVVRAAMLLRANSLCQGHSGVRPEVVKQIISFLNLDITPVVPVFGSVGASGDLAPLAHIALCLIGEGEVFYKNKKVKTLSALKKCKLKPLELQMKEGLALTNGVQFSTALGILSYDKTLMLLKTASLATALTAQVMLASDDPFIPELHALRPHQGAKVVADWIFKLMKDSPIRESHRNYDSDGEVQDPYNIRCAPQVLGACWDLIEDARKSIEIEINSATDNPLILKNSKTGKFTRIISGGHFHGMPIATRLYGIMEAMCILARLSNMRCVRFVDEQRNKGLGSDLIWPKFNPETLATSSGMMIAEYTSAALTNFIWGASMPNHLFSLSTDAGQEDHVSMSSTLALKVWETIPRVAEVLAIELAFCAQAAAIRKELSGFPSKSKFSFEDDQKTKQDIEALSRKIESRSKSSFKASLNIKFTKNTTLKERRLSPISEKILAKISRRFPVVKKDKSLSPFLVSLAKYVEKGELILEAQKFNFLKG